MMVGHGPLARLAVGGKTRATILSLVLGQNQQLSLPIPFLRLAAALG